MTKAVSNGDICFIKALRIVIIVQTQALFQNFASRGVICPPPPKKTFKVKSDKIQITTNM